MIRAVTWLNQDPKWRAKMEDKIAQIRLRPTKPLRALLPNKMFRSSTDLGPTSYLDGLRGFAALLVYIMHHQLWAHDAIHPDRILENAFGYSRQYYFACLPFIRNFFSGGHMAVGIFFVISGYVLSARALTLLRDGEMVKFGDNLASSLFRRWLRLYIPVILTTFVYMTLNHFIRGLTIHVPARTYWEEISQWYIEIKGFSFIFRTGGEPWFSWNFHVWTIPYEFKGSIVIYTALMAFSRCSRNARLWCHVGLIYYFLYITDGWYLATFVAGMLLADLDILAADNNLPEFFTRFEPYKDIIFRAMLVVGLYLGGVPAYDSDIKTLRSSPGWYFLSFFIPQAVFSYKSFYLFWSGIFIVASVPRIPWLKSFFETPFTQYLGQISYAFYLVHGPILWTVGDRIYAAVGWTRGVSVVNISRWVNIFHLPSWGPLGLEINFLLAQVILLPLTLWVARIAMVLVDEPSIKISRWLYSKATAKGESQALINDVHI